MARLSAVFAGSRLCNVLYDTASITSRTFWILVLIWAMFMVFLTSYQRVNTYLKDPVGIKYTTKPVDKLAFPGIVICNYNPVRLDFIAVLAKTSVTRATGAYKLGQFEDQPFRRDRVSMYEAIDEYYEILNDFNIDLVEVKDAANAIIIRELQSNIK